MMSSQTHPFFLIEHFDHEQYVGISLLTGLLNSQLMFSAVCHRNNKTIIVYICYFKG